MTRPFRKHIWGGGERSKEVNHSYTQKTGSENETLFPQNLGMSMLSKKNYFRLTQRLLCLTVKAQEDEARQVLVHWEPSLHSHN